MKLKISIQASNKTTQITVLDENQITINGETTDLHPIPLMGQADGISPIIGTITKDGTGENTLTVLMQYNPRNTEYNRQELQQITIDTFPAELTIQDFFVPIIVEPVP